MTPPTTWTSEEAQALAVRAYAAAAHATRPAEKILFVELAQAAVKLTFLLTPQENIEEKYHVHS